MKYRSGYKYQVAEDEVFKTKICPSKAIDTQFIHLTHGGILTVRSGYAWDGPSGPTIDTDDSMRGSLAHDAMYQLLRMELLAPTWREAIDDMFGEILAEDGMWSWRWKFWVREVKKFAGAATDPKNKKVVHTAP